MADNLGPKGEGLSDDAAEAAKKAADAAKATGGAVGKAAKDLAGGGVGKVGDLAGGAAGKVGGAAAGITGAAGGLASKGAGAVSGAASKGAGAVTGAASGVGGLAKGATSSVTGKGGSFKGWRNYLPPNAQGKYPNWLKWLPILAFLLLCLLGAILAWGRQEDLQQAAALQNLECEYGSDADNLDLEWSYRSVTVTGDLPPGVTAEQVERTIQDGPTDTDCGDSDNRWVSSASAAGAVAVAAVVAAPDPAPTPVPTAVPEPTAVPTAVPEPTATPEP